MKIDFTNVRVCPVCQAPRVVWNGVLPIEFDCGSYVYKSRKGWHFHQNRDKCAKNG